MKLKKKGLLCNVGLALSFIFCYTIYRGNKDRKAKEEK